ncbi:Uncharacterised protein [Candidatus Gugararchaeum adminiculabundum]|nr:Uncharacterised protein [Candidatus Gugararchaeum adminiculabundum]
MDAAVKRFIRDTALFLTLALALLFFINYFYESKVLPNHILEKKDQNYRLYLSSLDKKQIDYAFFGDSHFFNGIDPHQINGSFNFGVPNENYVKIYYKLKQILEQDHVQVKYVILEADLNSLSTLTTDETRLLHELWYYHNYVPFSDIVQITGKTSSDVLARSYLPIIGARENLVVDFYHAFWHQTIPELYRGWHCLNGSLPEDSDVETNALDRTDTYFKNQNITSPLALAYFEKTVRLADDNHITVILVRSPVSKPYDNATILRNITKEEYYARVFSALKNNTDDYYILDYSSLYFDYPEYFSDVDHLNCIGSEIFSRRLATDLESLNKTS